MDVCNTVTSPGLQDWFTDLDGWVCKFDASISFSRSHPNYEENANLDQTCKNCSIEARNEKTNENTKPCTENIKTQTSENVTLHELIVNGLLITQKKKESGLKNKTDFLNIFKGNDDFTHFDYVLLTNVMENGRKQVQKYILRSKI